MRAPGITNYYNRVTPAYKSSRNRPVKRKDKPQEPGGIRELPTVVPSPDIQQRERADAFDRQISIASQALFCFAIILLLLNVVNQVVKLCF